MSNSTTEQKATSQDKSIIQGIGFKEFSSICQEYQIVEKATKELLEIANDKNTPVRTKVDIYKWVVEMNVGKPKPMEILTPDRDITINIKEGINNPMSAGVIIDWDTEPKVEALSKELLARGMEQEQIDTILKEIDEEYDNLKV